MNLSYCNTLLSNVNNHFNRQSIYQKLLWNGTDIRSSNNDYSSTPLYGYYQNTTGNTIYVTNLRFTHTTKASISTFNLDRIFDSLSSGDELIFGVSSTNNNVDTNGVEINTNVELAQLWNGEYSGIQSGHNTRMFHIDNLNIAIPNNNYFICKVKSNFSSSNHHGLTVGFVMKC